MRTIFRTSNHTINTTTRPNNFNLQHHVLHQHRPLRRCHLSRSAVNLCRHEVRSQIPPGSNAQIPPHSRTEHKPANTSATARFGKYRTTRKYTLTKMATHPLLSKFLNTKRKAVMKKRCNTISPTSSMRKIARTSWRRAVP